MPRKKKKRVVRRHFVKGDTQPFCPAAVQMISTIPLLSGLRLARLLDIAPTTLRHWQDRAGVDIAGRGPVVRLAQRCGYSFCPAAVRMIWEPGMSKRAAAQVFGVADATFRRWMDVLGIDHGTSRREPKRISVRQVREAWLDKSMTAVEAGASIGLSARSLYDRAKKMGLPPRKSGPPPAPWPADFDMMWASGVSVREMGRISGRCGSHITHEVKRRGLPGRRPGHQSNLISLDEYRQVALAAAMRETAKIEQAAFLMAEMCDFARRAPGAADHNKRTAACS